MSDSSGFPESWPRCAKCNSAFHSTDKCRKQTLEDMACPFCGESNFDGPGLKGHLNNEDCEEYKTVEQPIRLL